MIKYEELQGMLQKNKNIPYPNIPKLYPNSRYCKMLFDSLGGEKGELTATTQYIYQHMSLQEEAISRVLRDIAIEEMHHLNILGNIITNLREKPIYKSSQDTLWTARNVEYEFENLKDIMRLNIKSEEAAIKGYKDILRYTNNGYLRRVYERIILDETTHLEIFKLLLNNVKWEYNI